MDNLLACLSPREGEILRHIADGKSVKELTETLSINEEVIEQDCRLILTKLVANDHNREVIEAAQSHLPAIISRIKPVKPVDEYITKDEFTTFKESLMERLKSFIGELK